jgi:hypothetical protein
MIAREDEDHMNDKVQTFDDFLPGKGELTMNNQLVEVRC